MSTNANKYKFLGTALLSLVCYFGHSGFLNAGPVANINFNALTFDSANAGVQSYMRTELQSAGYTGQFSVLGAHEGGGYSGEGYSVGPVNGSNVTSLYLGNTEGGVLNSTKSFDGYIYNSDDTKITMTFSDPIYGISFDFEIFPNGNVPDGTKTSLPFPDFTFQAFSGSQKVVDYFVVSVLPGTPGSYSAGLTHSPNSGATGTEKAPQFLGSASFVFPQGVDKLYFIDWPERIGVDNLNITLSQTTIFAVPEPTSVIVFGLALTTIGAGYWRRNRRAMSLTPTV